MVMVMNCVIDGVVVVVSSCLRLFVTLLVSGGGHEDVICCVGLVKMSLHVFVVGGKLMGCSGGFGV